MPTKYPRIFIQLVICCGLIATSDYAIAQQSGLTAHQQEAAIKLVQLKAQYLNQFNAGQFDDAKGTAQQLVDLVEEQFPNRRELLGASLSNLGEAQTALQQYEAAEQTNRRALQLIRQALGNDNQYAVMALNNLAAPLVNQGKFIESENVLLEAIALAEKLKLLPYPFISKASENLSNVYAAEGRYADAEKYARRALAIIAKAVGANHQETIAALSSVAALCGKQQRYAEAETLWKQVLSSSEAAYGRDQHQVSKPLTELGMFYLGQYRPREAAALLERSLAILDRNAPQGIEAAYTAQTLGWIYAMDQGRADDAKRLLDRAADTLNKTKASQPDRTDLVFSQLAILLGPLKSKPMPYSPADLNTIAQATETLERVLAEEAKTYGDEDVRLLHLLQLLATFRLALQDDAAAKALVERGQRILAAAHRPDELRSMQIDLDQTQARLLWRSGDREAALRKLESAINTAEILRSKAAGAEHDRAAFSAQFVDHYLRLADWCAEMGDIAAAFSAVERASGRVLQNQLELQHVDLLAGLPADQAATLRRRKREAQSRVSQMQLKIARTAADSSLADGAKQARLNELAQQLAAAQQGLVDVFREIRNASPAVRLANQHNHQPAPLTAVQAWCAERETLILEYVIGEERSWVLAIPPTGDSTAWPLTLTAEDGKTLEVPAGNLTRQALSAIMNRGDGQGVWQLLQEPQANAVRTEKLAALYRVLIPETLHEGLTAKQYKQLAIVPSEQLCLLPFDALVAAAGDAPVYLLDRGPPVSYAPSCTVLLNLVQRPRAPSFRDNKPVLTVGNPNYSTAAKSGDLLADAARASRAVVWGRELKPLASAEWECRWIAAGFAKQGVAAAELLGPNATEWNVRHAARGRRILHFACHGLADESHGNLFGALALTAGPPGNIDPANDGSLMLSEICELNLSGCELAILSACQTNSGPQERGEGAWALSRGFLVAGCRRVVASNWLVDDEAAASLISYFCAGVAQAERRSTQSPDYAGCLRNAKHWVRQQPKWRSPYYWATFALVGPN